MPESLTEVNAITRVRAAWIKQTHYTDCRTNDNDDHSSCERKFLM